MSNRVMKIGLWGGPGTGKTTFLAVLARAATRQGWAIAGSGEEAGTSNAYLKQNSERLFSPADRSFPTATGTDVPLQWTFRQGDGRSHGVPQAFDLALWDVPGGWYRDEIPVARKAEYIEHLAGCNGLIYLFDPVHNEERGDALLDVQNILLDLSTHLAPRRPDKGRMLPHFVAHCVTKFDDVEFFRAARLGGWVTQDDAHPRLPRIKDQHAEAFYGWLCRRSDADYSAASAVQETLKSYFAESRISYFITSAIGFRLLGPHQSFDLATNFSNFDDPGGGEAAKVFDPPEPVNVLEPVLALARNIARRGAAQWPK